MVAVFTLRAGAAGEGAAAGAAAGDEPHESLVVVAVAGADQASAVAAVVVESLVVADAPHAGADPHPAVASAVDSAAAVSPLSIFSELGISFWLWSETAVISVSALMGRPFLSPPFRARGAPLVAPPRPPREESKGWDVSHW